MVEIDTSQLGIQPVSVEYLCGTSISSFDIYEPGFLRVKTYFYHLPCREKRFDVYVPFPIWNMVALVGPQPYCCLSVEQSDNRLCFKVPKLGYGDRKSVV